MKVRGLSETIRHLERYRDQLTAKQREFLRRLAEIGIDVANVRFASAQYDGTNDVKVSDAPEWQGETKLRISASGRAVGFIEFGSGVHYSEQHPKAAQFGAVRGGYGYGLGKFDSWRYRGDPGTNGEVITEGVHAGEIVTHGNPPARAMYDAGKEMWDKILEIAREVFSDD